jgi:hypothetical protein
MLMVQVVVEVQALLVVQVHQLMGELVELVLHLLLAVQA